MGSDSALIEIIILAVVAGFLILRLRSVLGKRHGEEPPHYEDTDRHTDLRDEAPGNVTSFPGRPPVDADPMPLCGLASKLQGLDPKFDEEEFVDGAKEAFRMVLSAYAKGDRDTLRALTSDEVYEPMEGAITDREESNETLDALLVGIQHARLDDVETVGSVAQITVRYVSEQTNVLRNGEGQPIDGAPNQVETIVDLWTFERDMAKNDPNWRLIETDSGE